MKTRTNALLAFLFFAVFTALYFFTRASAYSYDGLCYALDVEFGPPTNLFHANHLLYGFFMRQVWHMAQQCGYSGQAIYVMQAANLVAAAAAVGLLFHLLAVRLGQRPAALAALWMGASQALWMSASDPGCYGLTTLAATLLLAVFFKVNEWPPFVLGFLQGVLVLFHQLLLLPALAFLLAFRARSDNALELRFPRIFYGMGLVCSGGIVYLALGWHFHGPGFAAVGYWLTHPADALSSPPSTRFWSFALGLQLVESLRGLAAAFIAQPNTFWILVVWIGLLGCGIIAFKARLLKSALWAWLLILFGFQLCYFPGTSTYRLLSWPPLFALLFAAPVWKRRRLWACAALAGILLLLYNADAAFHRQAVPRVDHERAAWVRTVVGPRDFFLFAGRGPGSILNVSMAYFAHDVPARSLYGYLFLQPDGNMDPLNRQLRAVQAAGGHLFIERALRDPNVLTALEKERGLAAGTLAAALAPWRITGSLEGPDGYRLDQSVLDFQAK